MPVSPEEQQKYIAFAQGIVDQLGCLAVEGKEIVWHYTSGEALINIVETGRLFATQVACLNDSTEVLYASNLFREQLITLQSEGNLSTEETRLVENVIKNNTDQVKVPSDWFVTCFSKEKDDLSQWRAYGGGENGYAIAFLVGGFFGHESKIARVNYDKDVHVQGAKEIARATLSFYMDGLKARNSEEDKATWEEEFLREWDKWITQLAPMVKDPAFRGENEFRIIRQFTTPDLASLHFRQKQSLMSLHLPLAFPPSYMTTQALLLPITEVMVGPGRHKDQSRLGAEMLMRQRGYNVPVTVSDIPFQTT